MTKKAYHPGRPVAGGNYPRATVDRQLQERDDADERYGADIDDLNRRTALYTDRNHHA
jgi:hypothetical protein